VTTHLSVNLNKVALLRNQRDLDIPSVARAAHAVIDAGAHGITVHPRPDARHTRAADVVELSAIARERGVEFNVEGYPSADFLDLVRRARDARDVEVALVSEQRDLVEGDAEACRHCTEPRESPSSIQSGRRASLYGRGP